MVRVLQKSPEKWFPAPKNPAMAAELKTSAHGMILSDLSEQDKTGEENDTQCL